MVHSVKNVVELNVGKFDAVRTLRDCLAAAERGEIKHVIVISTDALLEGEAEDGQDIWASWSQMERDHVHCLDSYRYHHRADPGVSICQHLQACQCSDPGC